MLTVDAPAAAELSQRLQAALARFNPQPGKADRLAASTGAIRERRVSAAY